MNKSINFPIYTFVAVHKWQIPPPPLGGWRHLWTAPLLILSHYFWLFFCTTIYLCIMYYVPSTILYFPYYLCLHGMIQYILGTSPTKTKKTFGTSTTNNKTTGTNSLFSCYGGALIGKFTDGGILLYRNSLSKYSIIHMNTKNYLLNTLHR